MRKLIAGVDPGTTCGVAIPTFDGNPIFVGSKRGWALPDLLHKISETGETIIVAADVSPAPELVEKVSKNFNAVLFTACMRNFLNIGLLKARLFSTRRTDSDVENVVPANEDTSVVGV